MINILIPMAGRGKRFADVGYSKPKPFIDVLGMPMIQRVMQNVFPSVRCRYIFVCLKDFFETYGEEFKSIVEAFEFESNAFGDGLEESCFVLVDTVTEGAACTCLCAEKYIDNENELLIVNCDQLVLDPYYMQASISYYREQKADGGILCFLNDSPKWSYAKLSGGKIIQVVEKQVVSDIATVGIYYYKTGEIFVNAAKDMIRQNIRVNNEFYVAPTYNQMIVNGGKVLPYVVNRMAGLGTPEDLREYLDRAGR